MPCYLQAPKNFPAERLYAIFYAIIPSYLCWSDAEAELDETITELCGMRLLSRSVRADYFRNCKWRVGIDLKFVTDLANEVGFDFDEYLWDWGSYTLRGPQKSVWADYFLSCRWRVGRGCFKLCYRSWKLQKVFMLRLWWYIFIFSLSIILTEAYQVFLGFFVDKSLEYLSPVLVNQSHFASLGNFARLYFMWSGGSSVRLKHFSHGAQNLDGGYLRYRYLY